MLSLLGGAKKIPITLENGWSGDVICEVSTNGNVSLRGSIVAGTGLNNTTLFKVPYEYRPKTGSSYFLSEVVLQEPVGIFVDEGNGNVVLKLPFGRTALSSGNRIRFNSSYQS